MQSLVYNRLHSQPHSNREQLVYTPERQEDSSVFPVRSGLNMKLSGIPASLAFLFCQDSLMLII